jgi:hypothetical protein
MKRTLVFILGLCFLVGAAFYGFASAADYSMTLTYCLVLDGLSFASFVSSYRMSSRLGKILSTFFAVVALAIAMQAIRRLFS